VSAHVVELLSAYLDGELAPAEGQAVESHLRGCHECARRLADFAALDALARDLPVEAPDGYFEALPSRVRFQVTPRRRVASRLPAWSWAAAAALVVAVVTPILLRQNPRPAEVAPSLPLAGGRADRGAPVAAAKPLPTPAAEPMAESELRVSSRDEGVARRRVAEAAPQAVQPPPAAPAAVAPADAPAVASGLAQGRLALNEAPAPLALAKEAAAKDKLQEARPAPPGKAEGAPAASAAFAAEPPEQGPAGQHLYEPKAESDLADAASAAPAEEAKKSVSAAKAAPPPQEAEKARGVEPPAPRLRFRTLAAVVPANAEAARRVREQWRTFLAQGPSPRQADEARVRMVEAGVLAWRLSNNPADLIVVKRDAEAYLRRADAAQGARVRALLTTIGG
jgi:Putative zinc-finger